MIMLILGIVFWVVGFALMLWYKRRKYYRSIRQAEEDYSEHVFKGVFDTALKSAGIASLLMGCVMVGSREYTDSIWPGAILLIFWLVYRLPIRSKK